MTNDEIKIPKDDLMTSVITWTRYDGSPETLPERGRFVMGYHTRDGHYPEDGPDLLFTMDDPDGAMSLMRLGDMWAHFPTPPPEAAQ